MARRQVIEVQCSRCERTETRPIKEDPPVGVRPIAAFSATLQAEGAPARVVTIEDLCTVCTKTVQHHLDAIAKVIEGVSPNRVGGKKKGEPGQPGTPSSP